MDLKELVVPEKPPEITQKKPQQIVRESSKIQKKIPAINEVNQNTANKHYVSAPKGSQSKTESGRTNKNSLQPPVEKKYQKVEPGSSVSGLLKPKKQKELSFKRDKFSVTQSRIIEEQIIDKLKGNNKTEGFGIGGDVDPSLLSFTGRFLNEANSHLTYPPQARQKGIEATGSGEVTFNRKGEIVDFHIIKSGGKSFDEYVLKAMKMVYVGPLPRTYKHDSATLPFFYMFALPPQSQR